MIFRMLRHVLTQIRSRYRPVEYAERYEDIPTTLTLYDLLMFDQDLHYHKGEFLARVSIRTFFFDNRY
jgi:hypothetical protein